MSLLKVCDCLPLRTIPSTALRWLTESWNIIAEGTGCYCNSQKPDTCADVPTPPSEHIPDEAKEQEPDAEERAKEVCRSDPRPVILSSIVWVC